MQSLKLTGQALIDALGGEDRVKSILTFHSKLPLPLPEFVVLSNDGKFYAFTNQMDADWQVYRVSAVRDAMYPPKQTLDEAIAVEPVFFLVLPTDGDVYRVKNGDFGDLIAQVGDNAGACELAADLQRYCELLRGAMPSIMTSEHKDIAAFIGADTNFQVMRSYSCGSYTYKLVHKADYQTTVLVNLPTDGYAAYAIAWLYNLFNV